MDLELDIPVSKRCLAASVWYIYSELLAITHGDTTLAVYRIEVGSFEGGVYRKCCTSVQQLTVYVLFDNGANPFSFFSRKIAV